MFSGCLVPAETGVPEPNSGWPRKGGTIPALGPERIGALRLRGVGKEVLWLLHQDCKKNLVHGNKLWHSGGVGAGH